VQRGYAGRIILIIGGWLLRLEETHKKEME